MTRAPAVPGGRRAAVLGHPVAHSLSPLLHNAAYAALGLDWTYEAIDCDVAALTSVLHERAGWAGFSCTMPLKHAVLDVAATVRPMAAAVGSANTLVPDAGGWAADNTDVAGIVAALAEYAVAPRSATVLGAGGTAQAAVVALLAIGAVEAVLLVRNPERAGPALDTATRLGLPVEVGQLTPGAAALGADLVVSTLPSGAADRYAGRSWSATQAVLDVAYDPWPSVLARAASASGARVVSGALMLLHQAAVQVELMTGLEPPVDEMRAALAAHLPHAGL